MGELRLDEVEENDGLRRRLQTFHAPEQARLVNEEQRLEIENLWQEL